MATQGQIETNEGLLGGALIQHLKSYIQLFVSETAGLQDVDIAALSAKVTEIVGIVDGNEESEGYQAFQGLLSDVATLKTDNTSNKARLTAVETALNAMDVAWKAAIAAMDTAYKAADTALGLRIDGVETTIAAYAAARLAKDVEHDSAIAALEAAKDTLVTNLATEVTRALAKEALLQGEIDAAELRLDAVELQAQDFATRGNVDSAFVKFCQGAETELWTGNSFSKPAGLPTFSPAA